MSRYEEFKQVGIVVPDIKKAMQQWIDNCGVGPWFYAEKVQLLEVTYNGKKADIPFAAALANSGDVQLELIQPLDDTPSIYKEFLDEVPRGGMQHWSSWPYDYDAAYKKALESGLTVAQEGRSASGRFVYFRNDIHPGAMVEMAEYNDVRQRAFGQVREAAKNWDGKDPIRPWPRG